MIFWLLCALLTAGGLIVLLRPLFTPMATDAPGNSPNVAIYQDQLAEIDRDKDRGLLNDEEAESARVEVSRRLIAAGEIAPDGGGDAAPGEAARRAYQNFATVLAIALVAMSMGSYLWLGAPGLPSKPHAQRVTADPSKVPVDELIARVEARLKENPNDARGWDVIAPVYLRRGEFAKSARAFQRAIQLNGESDRRLAQFAEAILGATQGRVTDAVKAAYERLLVLRPDYLPAQFWLAVGLEQRNEIARARQSYETLMKRKDLSPEMAALLKERLAEVGGKAAPGKPAADGSAPDEDGRGAAPSQEAQEELGRMSAGDRQKRIRAMVQGLSDRLHADGGDLPEWQRLIRALMVLGETDKARSALAKAKQSLAKEDGADGQLDAFAASLGLKAN